MALNKPEDYSVILTTCGNREEAEKIACLLIENRLAACIQITDVTSYYEWQNKITKDTELLLLIKAKSILYDEIEVMISYNHSYEIPEIIKLPIREGSDNYFKWINTVSK